ncbi:MAG: bifunctional proline dehydrogenase/L-glutamate gamma-semialdehyde dehydrogenase PutA, partial [Sphingomonadales bacterium]
PLLAGLEKISRVSYDGSSIIDGIPLTGKSTDVTSPLDATKKVGFSVEATAKDMEAALKSARAAQPHWNNLGGNPRADILDKMADLIEADRTTFFSLLTREAGKTVMDGISEVREAADYCRYYASEARKHFGTPQTLRGPTGESNQISLHGRGVFLCIAPWNFPLAIFLGQVAAGLASGNAVLAKPAGLTPLVAAHAVRLLHQAGVPAGVLHLIVGRGSTVGKVLVAHPDVAGVAMTGSTSTAKMINKTLAEKDGPIASLIAETGGQNAMIVDSSALPEQITDDVMISAFSSAGQRCSALRVLFLQDTIADKVLEMLKGALAELAVGDPGDLACDVGPMIDAASKEALLAHARRMQKEGKLIARATLPKGFANGHFFAPHIFEIPDLSILEDEVFGPILHVIRYQPKDIEKVLTSISETGYGLTFGVHSRIESRWLELFEKVNIGNTYVNRNMIGAVVGVQPFGGQGLSGTGPKAGGPHYLFRFATEKTLSINTTAIGGNTDLFSLEEGET